MTNVTTTMSPEVKSTLEKEPSYVISKTLTILFLVGMTIWGLSSIKLNFNEIGMQSVIRIIQNIVSPPKETIDSYWLHANPAQSVPLLILETMMIAFIGTVIGAIISIPFAFLSSKTVVSEKIANVGVSIITIIRTFPVYIWALIFMIIEGGALAGVLAIAVSSIGMISKLYIESIEDIDRGILEALDSTGATTIQKIRYGIIPQLVVNFLSTAIYRFEINVKNATLLGVVGAGGIGYLLIDATANNNFDVVGVILWGLIPTVIIIDFVSTVIRKKLTTGE